MRGLVGAESPIGQLEPFVGKVPPNVAAALWRAGALQLLNTDPKKSAYTVYVFKDAIWNTTVRGSIDSNRANEVHNDLLKIRSTARKAYTSLLQIDNGFVAQGKPLEGAYADLNNLVKEWFTTPWLSMKVNQKQQVLKVLDQIAKPADVNVAFLDSLKNLFGGFREGEAAVPPFNKIDDTLRLVTNLNQPEFHLRYLAHELSHNRAGTADNAYLRREKNGRIAFYRNSVFVDPLNVDDSVTNADTYAWFIYELANSKFINNLGKAK